MSTPVVILTPAEEGLYKRQMELRCAEGSTLITKIFNDARELPQQEVRFSRQLLNAIVGTLVGVLAQNEARLDILVKRERDFQQRLDRLESWRNGKERA